MGAWTEEFRKSPELGIMEQAYNKLRVQQPGLMPPSKPVKQQISADERAKEEEELQRALALSVQDKGAVTSPGAESRVQPNGTSREDSGTQEPVRTEAAAQGTTAATVSRVRALYDFSPSEPGELAFRKGDVIAVLESVYKDWWKGSLRGNTGIFPLNYVEKLQDPTKEELERDAQMEGEVFGEIKSVEKLLALLSVRGDGGGGRRGEREEEEISELYQRTLSIRPKLIELIGKYSQKKGELRLDDTGRRRHTDSMHRRLHATEREIHQSTTRLRSTSGVKHDPTPIPATIPRPRGAIPAANVPSAAPPSNSIQPAGSTTTRLSAAGTSISLGLSASANLCTTKPAASPTATGCPAILLTRTFGAPSIFPTTLLPLPLPTTERSATRLRLLSTLPLHPRRSARPASDPTTLSATTSATPTTRNPPQALSAIHTTLHGRLPPAAASPGFPRPDPPKQHPHPQLG